MLLLLLLLLLLVMVMVMVVVCTAPGGSVGSVDSVVEVMWCAVGSWQDSSYIGCLQWHHRHDGCTVHGDMVHVIRWVVHTGVDCTVVMVVWLVQDRPGIHRKGGILLWCSVVMLWDWGTG